MAKVSIVLPTYNGEKYIRKSIESIIMQTMQDWELIIVNDCSTDSTPEIIKEYKKVDSRIKIINNQTNQKLPNSLNIGFLNAEGEYLTWTSDDNYYDSNAIKVLCQGLDEDKDAYLVYSSMNNIDEYDNFLYQTNVCEDYERLACSNIVGACFLYRREVMETIGGYSSDLFLVEDYDYWLRIYEHYKCIKSISQPLYYYRRHTNSLTETKKLQIQEQLKKLKEKHLPILLEIVKDDMKSIYRIYYSLLKYKFKMDSFNKLFYQYAPELLFEKEEIGEDEYVIVFGAGELGKKALSIFKEKVVAFTDNDMEKVGTYIESIPIISFKDVLKSLYKNKEMVILIAVSESHIYEIVQQLQAYGDMNFRILQDYLFME